MSCTMHTQLQQMLVSQQREFQFTSTACSQCLFSSTISAFANFVFSEEWASSFEGACTSDLEELPCSNVVVSEAPEAGLAFPDASAAVKKVAVVSCKYKTKIKNNR